jgi:hypothetical protein
MRFLFITLITSSLLGCFSTVKSNQHIDTEAVAKLSSFDYTDWQAVLQTRVNSEGRVDYRALKKNRAPLDRFVALLSAVGPTTRPDLFESTAQQLSYYINAYNAFTMFNVINRLPEMKSVNDDIKSFFYFTEFEMDGAKISLYKLENELIRPKFQEPRIHFALNCASVGCPQLPAEVFRPETLEAQLARETTKFLHERRNVTVEGDKVVLSMIFKWYKEDFPPSVMTWIINQAKDLKLPSGAPVNHRPYDWALNVQTP